MAKGDVLVRMKADVGNYNANLANARRTLQNFKEENLSLGGVIRNMTRSFTGYAAGLMSIGAVAGKLHETVTEAVALAKAGEGIRIAFSRLNDPNLLKGLREATHGTVTDIELMKAAVKFDDFKLPVSELGTMLAFAQQKAKDTGQSVDYMVDSIVTGLGRKSLMILDNLGLSATEVKEKMKETGDMTKAVGEIIREQMAKSGDYVETAADRAAQANVSMQNKMEELGRKFAPLEEASSSLWASMKLGILDVVSGPLTTLINNLTRVGRMMNAYGKMGGDDAIGRQISALATASNPRAEYFKQMTTYRATNLGLNKAIGAIEAWQGGDHSEDRRAEIEKVKSTYGLVQLNTTPLRAALDANIKAMEEYQKNALSILNPVNKAIAGDETQKPGKIKTPKLNEILPAGSVAELNRQMQELRKEQSLVTSTDEWKQYEDKIKDVNNQIRELKGELGIESLRGLKGVSISEGIKPLTSKDIKNVPASIKNLKLPEQPKQKKRDALEDGKAIVGGLQSISSGLQQMGIELPEGIQRVIGVLQGITSILTGISTIVSVIETVSTADSVIPFAGGGIVHAAGGFRVPGHSFSGDRVPALLNSGELVLNTGQQEVVAQALMSNNGGGRTYSGNDYVSGQNVFIGTNNYLRGSGQGQLVTTRMLRQYGLIH